VKPKTTPAKPAATDAVIATPETIEPVVAEPVVAEQVAAEPATTISAE
jgi:hypothetical protein